MASLVKAWVRNPSEFYRVNVGRKLKNVMECALEEDVTKIYIHLFLYAIGPSNGKLNTEETQHDPDHLHNHYERTKYIADQLTAGYLNKGLPVITVYPCVIYGPEKLLREIWLSVSSWIFWGERYRESLVTEASCGITYLSLMW